LKESEKAVKAASSKKEELQGDKNE